jgi:hypothetical protein
MKANNSETHAAQMRIAEVIMAPPPKLAVRGSR